MSEKRTKSDKAQRQADQLEKKVSPYVDDRIKGKNHARTSAKPLCGSSKRQPSSTKPVLGLISQTVLRKVLFRCGHVGQDRRRLFQPCASQSSTDVGHNDESKNSDPGEVQKSNSLRARVLSWGTEIPLLAHNFPKRAAAIRRPSQDKLLGAWYLGFFEEECDMCEFWWLIED